MVVQLSEEDDVDGIVPQLRMRMVISWCVQDFVAPEMMVISWCVQDFVAAEVMVISWCVQDFVAAEVMVISWCVQDFFEIVDQHFNARMQLLQLQKELAQRAQQFVSIQRRLLVRFKVRGLQHRCQHHGLMSCCVLCAGPSTL
jgi:PTHB1 C-terminus